MLCGWVKSLQLFYRHRLEISRVYCRINIYPKICRALLTHSIPLNSKTLKGSLLPHSYILERRDGQKTDSSYMISSRSIFVDKPFPLHDRWNISWSLLINHHLLWWCSNLGTWWKIDNTLRDAERSWGHGEGTWYIRWSTAWYTTDMPTRDVTTLPKNRWWWDKLYFVRNECLSCSMLQNAMLSAICVKQIVRWAAINIKNKKSNEEKWSRLAIRMQLKTPSFPDSCACYMTWKYPRNPPGTRQCISGW